MRDVMSPSVWQAAPLPAPKRGRALGLMCFGLAIGLVVLAVAGALLERRMQQLESRAVSAEACLKNLHVVMYRTPHDAIAAAVDCPTAKGE